MGSEGLQEEGSTDSGGAHDESRNRRATARYALRGSTWALRTLSGSGRDITRSTYSPGTSRLGGLATRKCALRSRVESDVADLYSLAHRDYGPIQNIPLPRGGRGGVEARLRDEPTWMGTMRVEPFKVAGEDAD
jgi:hypothetical protein